MTAAAADVVLMTITRLVPWRTLPLLTAVGVAALAALAAIVIGSDALTAVLAYTHPIALVALGVGAAAAANVVNNLPALLLALDGVHRMSWGMWAWLLGVNAGAVLLPVGALANLLWLRVVRAEGLPIGPRRYLKVTVPIALPAFTAALVVLALERALVG